MRFILLLSTLIPISLARANTNDFPNTAHRIATYNYPSETHTTQTVDGYVLTMFRIPHSPKLANRAVQNKSVVFLQHGFSSSSDTWILNGPENGLPFLLADAGYDVWLGNMRGNIYSLKHIKLSPQESPFWNFSFHQVGIYDLPAMFDYALQTTGEPALHYVGHSQATSAFLALMSVMPHYIGQIKTSHLLAPIAYMNHMRSPLVALAAPLLGRPSPLSAVFQNHNIAMYSRLLAAVGGNACKDGQLTQIICAHLIFIQFGYDPFHLNYTLLPEYYETLPAGGSTTEIVHYVQEFKSGYFRQYDYGHAQNLQYYNQTSPPEYMVERIQPEVPVQLYYADNDLLSSPEDVLRLAERMGSNAQLYHVQYPLWSHIDYLIALDVKAVINDRIIHMVNEYENK